MKLPSKKLYVLSAMALIVIIVVALYLFYRPRGEVETLTAKLNDQNEKIEDRLEAAYSLAVLGNNEGFDLAKDYASRWYGEIAHLRERAFKVLAAMADDKAVKVLTDQLDGEDPVKEIEALRALKTANNKTCIPAVKQKIEARDDPSVCGYAITLLGELGSEDDIPFLQNIAKNNNWWFGDEKLSSEHLQTATRFQELAKESMVKINTRSIQAPP